MFTKTNTIKFVAFLSVLQGSVLLPGYVFKNELKNEQLLTCIQKQAGDDLAAEKKVFVSSFLDAYKDFSLEQLKVDDKKAWLGEAFDDEQNGLNSKKENIFFFSAVLKDVVVGMISFNSGNENELYVRQLAVDPLYNRIGIGSALMATCLKVFPKTKKIILATRRVNEKARAFYGKHEFKETKEVPHGLSAERYVGLERIIN